MTSTEAREKFNKILESPEGGDLIAAKLSFLLERVIQELEKTESKDKTKKGDGLFPFALM